MNRIALKLLAAALLLTGAQQAFAQVHTGAGVKVGNTATVDYKVGTIDQTQESGTADFVVDRLVNVTVTTTDSAETGVVPNTNHVADSTVDSKVLRFQINNQTNAAIGVTLVADNGATSTVNPFGAAPAFPVDAFNVGGEHPTGTFRIYRDVDADGIFEPGTDDGAAITSIASIPQETSYYVFVVADIPAVVAGSPANGDVAVVSLQATAVDPTTLAAITYLTSANDDTANAEGSFDSIAGDVTPGVVAGETPYDGVDSAYSAYKVSSAQITVTKASFVLWDPINLLVKPKAIPGARVLYCIEVANDGNQSATDVTINDNIPDGTTYYTGSGGAGTIRVVAPNGDGSLTCDAAAASAGVAQDDEDAFVAGSPPKVTTTVTTLASDEKTSTVFQVTID